MVRAALALVLLAANGGCAFVLHRHTQPLQIDSDPPGATATVDGKSCQTPCELVAPRRSDAVVTVSKEGYEPVAAVFRSRLGEATLLDLLLPAPGVFVGLAADVASGAAYDLVPPMAVVPLRPASPEPRASPPQRLELAPLRPVRCSWSLELGAGTTLPDESTGILQAGALGTCGVYGPLVVGAAVDVAGTFIFSWDRTVGLSTWSAVAGAGFPLTRNSWLVALLQGGLHRYNLEPGRVNLPVAGARLHWTAVFADRFTLGAFGAWLYDLDRRSLPTDPWNPRLRVGGATTLLGLSIGGLIR